MMEAAIEARELRYIYEDGTAALKGINLRAERGKITGILGANGAGKSTLFLNLNGVLQPSDGEILLDGVPVKRDRKGLTELRRRVGIVFQDPDDQLFSADVYRDISFGAVNLGLPEAEVRSATMPPACEARASPRARSMSGTISSSIGSPGSRKSSLFDDRPSTTYTKEPSSVRLAVYR